MNNDEIKSVIAKGENDCVEFKESFGDEVIISLVSFANARGGKVIVGVNRNKEITGASVSAESVQNWLNEVKTKTFRELSPLADYRQTASIRIYPDRIIFSNYGGLPAEFTVEDFINGKAPSYLRNKLIAKVFKEANVIEEYSSGLKRVNKTFKGNGNPPAEFFVNPQSFTVFAKSINSKALQENLKDAREDARKNVSKTIQKISRNYPETIRKILVKISENPRITISGLAKATGLSNIGVRYDLKKLKKSGVIRRVGPDRGGHWEIIGGGRI